MARPIHHRFSALTILAPALIIMLATVVSPASSSAARDGDAGWLLSHINAERQAAGLAPLAPDPRLAGVARSHALDMIARHYFSHITPDGATAATRLARGGIRFAAAGENLAGHSNVVGAHEMLMASQAHRAVILSPRFTRAGIAVVRGGPYGLMIVELFIQPRITTPREAPSDAGRD